MDKVCDIAGCEKKAIVRCSDCDLDVCKDHSRNGKCIYHTTEGIVINTKALDKFQKVIEKREKEMNKIKME